MDERDARDPLRDLEQRLDRARRGHAGLAGKAPGESDGGDSRNALGLGLRIGLELVVAVFVGAGIGWAFDNWLGTQPWGLVGFLFLGFAAGVVNIFRMATGMERAVGFGPPKPGPQQPVDRDDED